MPSKLTLVIPGLTTYLKACEQAGLSFSGYPVLSHLLTGTKKAASCNGLDQTLSALFSLPEDKDFPHAHLYHLHHAKTINRKWRACLSPATLIADKDGLIMDKSRQYNLTPLHCKEAREIATDNGLNLEVTPSKRWFLTSDEPLEVKTTPLNETWQQRTDCLLPTGPDSPKIHRFMSDCQMAFAHMNQRRQFNPDDFDHDDVWPNALWVWGSGIAQDIPKNNLWDSVYCDGTALKALGALTPKETQALPKNFNQIQHENGNSALIILPFFKMERSFNAPPKKLLKQLESCWLKPIETTIRKKALSAVDIHLCDDGVYKLGRMGWVKRVQSRLKIPKNR